MDTYPFTIILILPRRKTPKGRKNLLTHELVNMILMRIEQSRKQRRERERLMDGNEDEDNNDDDLFNNVNK